MSRYQRRQRLHHLWRLLHSVHILQAFLLVGLKPKLDAFFEQVMVMVEDQELKSQRLALLSSLVRWVKRVADLSEIQCPEKSG